MKLNVNGTLRGIDVEPQMPLLWALREQLNLTGTKYGCAWCNAGLAKCISMASQPALARCRCQL